MTEFETLNLAFVEKDENVVAYCASPGCRSIIFKGTDHTRAGNRSLINIVTGHFGGYEDDHEIDIIYPRRNKFDRIVSLDVFLEKVVLPKELIKVQLAQRRAQEQANNGTAHWQSEA